MNLVSLFDIHSDRKLLHVGKRPSDLASASMNELMEKVNVLSQSLLGLGVTQGDRALILCSNRLEMIEALLAVFNIGAVAVPVNPEIGVSGIEAIVRLNEPALCFFDSPLPPGIQAVLSPSCKAWIKIGEQPSPEGVRCHAYTSLLQGRARDRVFHPLEEAHPAIIIHSSGSSGRPKAVVRSHGVLREYLLAFFKHHHDRDVAELADRPLIIPLPLSHLGGLAPCLTAMLANRPVYVMLRFDPVTYLRFVSETRSDTLILIPSMYALILNRPDFTRHFDFGPVKYCIHLGEACADSVVERMEETFQATSINAYGLTECMAGIGYTTSDHEGGRIRKGSCGRLLYGEARLVDEEGRDRPDEGELWVKNQTVEACYLDESLNQQKFHQGWFRTGDRFHRDADGYFYWRGRTDDMFTCNGNNVYPIEVEKAVLGLPAIACACVVPITNRGGATVPAVLAVLREGEQPLADAEVIAFLATRGPAYAIPQFVAFHKEIPTIGPGKVDRRRIATMLQEAYEAFQSTSRQGSQREVAGD